MYGQLGPFLVVRQTSLSGFRVGVSVRPLDPIPNPRVWLVAAGSAIGARGRVPSPSPRQLADVAPTLRELLRLPRDTSLSAGRPLAELHLQP